MKGVLEVLELEALEVLGVTSLAELFVTIPL